MTESPDLARRSLLVGLSALPAVVSSKVDAKQKSTGKASSGNLSSGKARSGKARSGTAHLAPKPPMGWNSWNSFATTINESEALETARIMARSLKPFGYSVFTIDIQWYEPNANSYTYAEKPTPRLDDYGRLLPAVNRFPSANGDHGFRPLADEIHGLGLEFGIHLMRGIPRLAVENNLPILGTTFHARDIANLKSTCPWNPDMYGVDMAKPGAQAYYDSVFSLYASWGVDFVKMDDMSRPYDAHAPEIEAAHHAIHKSGRPILLSLSPGETPVARADHVRTYAQMWRISDDFWDDWSLLSAQFTRLETWNSHRSPGGWPDADMLPLGRLALGQRDTKFSPAEQTTLMTLWSIARSPLIMGGDLRHLDQPTLDLLTNSEVLDVNQNSHENRPLYLADGWKFWTARSAKDDHLLAIFNLQETAQTFDFDLSHLDIGGPVHVRDLWAGSDLGRFSGQLACSVPSHGARLYRFQL